MASVANALSSLLAPLAVLCVLGATTALVLVAYESGLRDFFAELRADSFERKEDGPLRSMLKLGLTRLGTMSEGLLSERSRENLRRTMIMAGLDMRDSLFKRPEDVLALQEVGSALAVLLLLWMTQIWGLSPVWVLLGPVLGVFLPGQWLRDQIKRRHLLIARALPYNLDLLTLSVEAGLDFTGGLNKVVERGRQGPLLDELALVLRQLKMGKTRAESLKMMVERVNMPALTTFVSAIIQADRMGSPLGRILRIQSQQLRVDRSQRAEKLANEAPVKMLGPLIFCIFPTVFLILFSPIAYQLLNQ